MEPEVLGRRIAAARLKAGLKQETLSQAIHCSRQHLSGIETGTVDIQLQELFAIAKELRVHPLDLLANRIPIKHAESKDVVLHDKLEEILLSKSKLSDAARVLVESLFNELQRGAD
jgi:transcriptional regulator with XRE-family HTH domain